ncbi:hypothetical protein SH139x_001958 [Planctomycetaceae bacterium SH139]
MDPGPLTLRELMWMADARRHAQWGQVSSVLAAIYEVNRDPKKRRKPFQPQEFNPLLRQAASLPAVTVTQLASMFKASGFHVRTAPSQS